MKRYPLTAAAVLAALAPLAGCSKPQDQVVRTMRPQVHWEDLAAEPVDDVDDTFANLATEGTDGLFPTSIAVARITVDEENLDEQHPHVLMQMTPPNDFLSWNALFDNLRYVSESFPLHSHDLGEDAPSAARIVSAAAELTAGLCLVYGRSEASETESEVRGVLYQAQTGKPLAAIHARVAVPAPDQINRPPEQVRGDDRHRDPRFLADLRFQRLVLDCIRDLRRGDRPVVVEPPEGWRPDQPTEPRVWPPPPFGTPQ